MYIHWLKKKKVLFLLPKLWLFCITGRALTADFCLVYDLSPRLSYTPTVCVSVTMSASVFVHRSDCHRNTLLAPFNCFTRVCESFVALVSLVWSLPILIRQKSFAS
jgi:hypothetical protein